MYSHLFDYDNIYINKLEAIIDRFMEICEIPENQTQKGRDRMVGMISASMVLDLALKLPKDEQTIAKEILSSPSLELSNTFKSKFKPDEIKDAFHNSAKKVLAEKIEVLKDKLTQEKVFELENLLNSIGKF